MRDFRFERPGSLAEAAALLEGDDDAKLLAGGQSLLPLMKLDLAMPSTVVTLADVEELRGIRVDADELVIGAATRHAEVACSREVADTIPALAALASKIGDAQVRNRGTLGGSIAHADPVADYPAALLALRATVETVRSKRCRRREIGADDFFSGLFETRLAPDEIVTSVRFPISGRAAYAKFPNPASKFALVGVMVARDAEGAVRVAVTGAAPTVFRVAEMEAALAGDFAAAAIADSVVDAVDLFDDVDASAVYRAHLIGVMARRAVAACA
jgi:carbon-monoxide dehydrogenase medium subunit